MLKELILSTFLTCAIGVSSINYDLTPNRAYDSSIVTFNGIGNLTYVQTDDSSYNGTDISFYDGWGISYKGNTGVVNHVPYTYNGSLESTFVDFDTTNTRFRLWDNTDWSQSYPSSLFVNADMEFYLNTGTSTYRIFPFFQAYYGVNNWLTIYRSYDSTYLRYRYFIANNINIDDVHVTITLYSDTDNGTNEVYFRSLYLNNNVGNFELTTLDYATWSCFYLDFDYNPYYEIANEQGYTSGYNWGYSDGSQDGFDTGYRVGYEDGAETHLDGSLTSLFFTIADTPIMMLHSLFDFNVLGISIFALFAGVITILVALFIIRKIIKL